jgi:hypothetical protein
MPIGVPEHAKLKMSRFVKSGLENFSFSKSFDHGSFSIKPSAYSTSVLNFLEVSLSTTATNPSNSALAPSGSKYVSINPIFVSTTGPTSFIQNL